MQKKLGNYIKSNKYISNILGLFEIKEQLGQGGTSVVRRAILNNSEEFAIKFLLENIKVTESRAYKRFKQAHINLLKIQNTGAILPQIHFDSLLLDNSTEIPYIIMLKADKTLKEFKKEKEIDFETFEKIFISLANLLKIIHNNKIIHRDIKPENIFIINKKLVLGDFDIAKFDEKSYLKLHKTDKSERLANYYFSAPEQSEKKFEEITPSADLYAFGQILYWLLTNETLRGQSKIELTKFDKRYKKYELLLNNILQHKETKRFRNVEEILKFLKDHDNLQKEYIDRENKFKTLKIFDEIIDKYTPSILYQQFKMFDNIKDINEIMTDLSKKCDKLDLWWSQGNRDYTISHIKKYFSLSFWDRFKEKLKQNTIWVLGDFEIEINSIWMYKYGDLGGSFIIIESKPMKSFGIFKNKYDIEEVVIFNNRYIPKSHYDNGWTLYKGKRLKIDKSCEFRRRHLHKDIFFIAPYAGSITNKENMKIINYIYEQYKKGAIIDKSFLKPLKNLRRKPEIIMWS